MYVHTCTVTHTQTGMFTNTHTHKKTIIISNIYIAPNPKRLAQSTSQFKTRMNITIKTWNMHTPDDPMPTAKHRQTCTHPGTIDAIKTSNAAIHGQIPWLQIKCKEYHNKWMVRYIKTGVLLEQYKTHTHTCMHVHMHVHMHAHTHTKTALFKFQLEPFQNFEVGAFFCCSTLLFHTHTHTQPDTACSGHRCDQTGVEQWGREGRHSINRRVARAALRQMLLTVLFAGACHLSTHPHSPCVCPSPLIPLSHLHL